MRNVSHNAVVAAGVAMNMRHVAEAQKRSAALMNTSLHVETRVHIEDGSKHFATALAKFLCENPEYADSTRADLAGIITRELNLATPFNAVRLSKALSDKARRRVVDILKQCGYPTDALVTALDIREIVKAGKAVSGCLTHKTETRFDVDAVTFNGKRYEYCLFDETSNLPWYRLGLRFAGRRMQLATILAIRSIGIGEFQNMDETAHKVATREQLATRGELMCVRGW